MSARRAVVAVLSVLLLAALGYGAYWFHVAGQLRKEIQSWADDRRAAGWEVTWQSLDVGGFPTRLEARMATPRLSSPAGMAWTTPMLRAQASPFDLTRIELSTEGMHRLSLPEMGETTITARTAAMILDLTTDGALEEVGFRGLNLSAQPPGMEPVTVGTLAAGLRAVPVENTPTVAFSFSAVDVGLPPMDGLLLDDHMAVLEVDGRVAGPFPKGAPLEALMEWSEQGGVVELARIQVEWPPVAMEGDGTLAFDPAMQPLVALSARLRGFAPLMDRLGAAGTMEPGAVNAAKMVLSLLAKPDSMGRPAITVPLTVQDGKIYLGPVPVGRVPPIPWPRD